MTASAYTYFTPEDHLELERAFCMIRTTINSTFYDTVFVATALQIDHDAATVESHRSSQILPAQTNEL